MDRLVTSGQIKAKRKILVLHDNYIVQSLLTHQTDPSETWYSSLDLNPMTELYPRCIAWKNINASLTHPNHDPVMQNLLLVAHTLA